MKKKLIIVAVGALVVCGLLLSSGALAVKPTPTDPDETYNGNGMPSGKHYNLNIIGAKDPDGSKDVGPSSGHTLFVKLSGTSKIIMEEGTEFKVVDRNGLDKNGARFTLPENKRYDVYARALGKPGGWLNISAWTYNKSTGEYLLYLGSVEFNRYNGKPETENLRKLFCINNQWIFDILDGEGYLWDYNNRDLKLLQVRFYENPDACLS